MFALRFGCGLIAFLGWMDCSWWWVVILCLFCGLVFWFGITVWFSNFVAFKLLGGCLFGLVVCGFTASVCMILYLLCTFMIKVYCL